MDVWRLTVAALRRWYILLPLLALTGLAALQAGQGVQPQYEVTATAMLVPGTGTSAGDFEVPNPYGGMDNASQVVAIVLNSNDTRAEIAAQGLNPGYEVAAASRSTILNMNVTDPTQEGGIATLDAVIAAAATELETRQTEAGVPAGAQYGLSTIAPPAVSAVVDDGKTRIMAIIGVIGAALAFLVAVLFDDIVGLINRRRKKRRDRKAAKLSAQRDDTAVLTDGQPAITAVDRDAPGHDVRADKDDETGDDDQVGASVDSTEDASGNPELSVRSADTAPSADSAETDGPDDAAGEPTSERMVPAGRER